MDRRAKKLEKKRKSREQAKKNARALASRKSQELALLARSAGTAEFGPCYVAEGYDNQDAPALVTVLVTRKLSSGHFVPAVALVDRTCLGVKDAYAREPMDAYELKDFVNEVGTVQELLECEPLIAQSMVFHAVDYARSLGFEPHRDFPAALFGPRPAELAPTPWRAPTRPMYMSGPRDNVAAITGRLEKAVGLGGFDVIDGLALENDLFDGEDFDDEDFDDESVARLGPGQL